MFTITPRGYYFRKRLHRRVDGIVNAFKQAPQRVDGAALDSSDAEALGYQPPAYAAHSRRVSLPASSCPAHFPSLARPKYLLLWTYEAARGCLVVSIICSNW